MKITEDYLTILFNEIKNTEHTNLDYLDVANKIICFERSDFVNAMQICKAFKNENALYFYSKELEKFDNGVLPNIDYFDWCKRMEWFVGKNRRYAKKREIIENIRNTFHNENFKQGEEIKKFAAAITNMIWFKAQARKQIEDFTKQFEVEQGSLASILEIVG